MYIKCIGYDELLCFYSKSSFSEMMEPRRLICNPLTSLIFLCFPTVYHGACFKFVDVIYDPNENYSVYQSKYLYFYWNKTGLLAQVDSQKYTHFWLDCTQHFRHVSRVGGLSLLHVFLIISIHSTVRYCSVIFKTR